MNLDKIEPQMRPIVTELSGAIRRLTERYENGTIDLDAWYEAMKRLLARYHTTSMMIGLGVSDLPQVALDMVESILEVQYDFLDGFYDDMKSADEFQNKWYYRGDLYALSALVPFEETKVYKKIGRFLPLPAMPKQGTQCGNNCGCEWRIVEINKENEDYDCYWERSLDDSCQTCVIRERTWSPVYIRGGMLLYKL